MRPQSQSRAQNFQQNPESAPPYSQYATQPYSRIGPDRLHRNPSYGFPELSPHQADHHSSKPIYQSSSEMWNGNDRFGRQPGSSYPVPSTQQLQAVPLQQNTPHYSTQPPQNSQPATIPVSYGAQPRASPSVENADAALLSKTLAFINDIPPAPSQPVRLPRPILIPQLPPTRGLGTPFMRGWAPCLSSNNLTADHFLAFIDNLNVISLPSPPLQIMKLAGSVIGMVPNHWAALAGTGLEIGVGVGTRVVSKARTDAFLKQVNARVFEPRRMRARIVKGEEIPRLLRMTEAQASLDNGWDQDLLAKVLKNVEPFSAKLTRQELPISEGQTGLLDRWSTKAVEREKAKIAKKASKQHKKQIEKEDKRARKEEKKSTKTERKQEKKEKKHKRKGEEAPTNVADFEDSDSDSEDSGQHRRDGRTEKTGKAREKEQKAAKKLLWIMIETI